jgi:hypothetical protein
MANALVRGSRPPDRNQGRRARGARVPARPFAAVKKAADEHKYLAGAMRDIKLPKYEKWANYDAYLPMNIERYCDSYSLGI